MEDPNEGLVQYVQLQALKQSQAVLFDALASLLLEMPIPQRRYWLQALAGRVQGSLQSLGRDHSGAAGALRAMFQHLHDVALEDSSPPRIPRQSIEQPLLSSYESDTIGCMNQLPLSKRTQILQMLVEGSSMRSTSRIVGVSMNTVIKLFVEAGEACVDYHDQAVRCVQAGQVQCDEIWSFSYAKRANVAEALAAPEDAGDVWTWIGLDPDTKLIVSSLVGGRDMESAIAFMTDLRGRVSVPVTLVTDQFGAYPRAIEEAFGADAIHLQKAPTSDDGVSTSHVERHNLTMRMSIKRFTRRSNAFSKKVKNHRLSVALHTVHYNWIRPIAVSGGGHQRWSRGLLTSLTIWLGSSG